MLSLEWRNVQQKNPGFLEKNHTESLIKIN